MNNDTLALTDAEVLMEAQTTLENTVPLSADGYECSTDDLYKVLLGASVQRSTIEAVCAEMMSAPVGNTIRGYLNEQLSVAELPELENRLNQALSAHLPERIGRQRRIIAMDMHDRPYYGKTTQEAGLWVRGRAKDGTTRFYRLATAYVIVKGLRFTLALCFVLPEDKPTTVIQQLWARVAALAVPIKCLLLDRGFAGIDTQDYLHRQGIPAIIACPIRGKQGGTHALCRGRKGYRTQHTFSSNGGRKQRTAELVVCRTFTTAKRTKRLKRRAMWQVFILIHLDLTPRQVRRCYRRRFGIETSYRCASQVCGWTTSPNPVLRFLLMALAVYLVNVWVWLRWHFMQIPRRGHRQLNEKAFHLSRFARFIIHQLEEHYGIVRQITAVAAPLP
jgi:putative transposase